MVPAVRPENRPVHDRKTRQRRRALGWLLLVLGCAGGIAWAFTAGLKAGTLALAVSAGLLAFAHRQMIEEGGAAVLVYHSVSSRQDWLPWADDIAVTPESFDRQLALLRRHGFAVMRTRDFVAARRAGRPLPPRPVVVHLDDGYLDTWVAALPILRRHGVPATVFVSLDFIEPGAEPRPTLDDVAAGRVASGRLRWDGYLNEAEIRALDASDLVEVEAHGTDHGRVETGPAVVDRLTPENWRRLAWVQWRALGRDLWAWYLHAAPPAVPPGAPVRASAPALAARAWIGGTLESEAAYAERVRGVLVRSRGELSARLGRPVTVFCWPENAATPLARRLALDLGYLATTAGRGENRADEDPTVISRVHAGDRALGWHWPWADDLRLLAAVRLMQGNYYWYFLVAGYALCRLVVATARRLAPRRPAALPRPRPGAAEP